MKKKTIFITLMVLALMAFLVYAFDPMYIEFVSPPDDNYWSLNQDNISFIANCSALPDNLVSDIIIYANNSGTYSAIVNDSTGGAAGVEVQASFTAAELNLSGLGEGETFEWAIYCIGNGSHGNRTWSANRTVYVGNGPTFNTQTPSGAEGASLEQNITLNVSDTAGTDFFNCDMYTNRSGTNRSDSSWEVEDSLFIANNTETSIKYFFDDGYVTKWNVKCSRHPLGNYYRWGTNRTFEPNATALNVSFNDIVDGDYVNHANYSINFTPKSDFLSQCWLYQNGTLNDTMLAPTNAAKNTFYWHSADVNYTDIVVMCNDTLNNFVNSSTVSLTKDTGIPRLTSKANYSIFSCTKFGINFTAAEACTSSSVFYGLGTVDSTWTNSETADSNQRYHNFTFGYYTDLQFTINISLTDLAGNTNNTVATFSQTSPVGLCAGWSLYSYTQRDNMTYIESAAPVTEYIYLWNASTNAWNYKANGSGTNKELNAGDAIFIYSTLNGNWYRNYSYSATFSRNLDNGSNYLGLLDNYTFGEWATISMKNGTTTTSGNITNSTAGGGRLQFRIENFAVWNNTAKRWVNKFLGYSIENTTRIGEYANNSLDSMWLWSDHHVTYNSGNNKIVANWSTT